MDTDIDEERIELERRHQQALAEIEAAQRETIARHAKALAELDKPTDDD